MSLKTRRLLYITFILAFLILTPLLIFYALGYSINSGFKIEKSGILVINTEPKGAKISIEDKNIQKLWSRLLKKDDDFIKSPAKIKSLKPGNYNITVELPGYWPWTKKLTIRSGQTTFAEDIYLFRNDKPVLIDENDTLLSDFSPNKKYFININQEQVTLVDLKSEEVESAYLQASSSISTTTNTLIEWSSDEKKIMDSANIFSVNDLDNPIYFKSLIGENLLDFKWDNLNSNNLFYYTNNKLFSFDTNNNHNKEIIDIQNIISFLPRDNNIYLIERQESHNNLLVFNRDSNEKTVKIELPFSDYRFVNTNHNLINLLDTNNKILYLIDQNSNLRPLKETIYACNKMQWITNNTLLYTTDFEIWLFDLNTLEKELLTRISKKISNVEWHPSNNYVLFSTTDSINILELDDREKHNIIKIADFENIDKMQIDKKGEVVYFNTIDNNTSKLYKIFIQ